MERTLKYHNLVVKIHPYFFRRIAGLRSNAVDWMFIHKIFLQCLMSNSSLMSNPNLCPNPIPQLIKITGSSMEPTVSDWIIG